MQIFFISGTDTNIGKTLVSALLCRYFSNQKLKVTYIKAVQTGMERDQDFISHICGHAILTTTLRQFPLPASPHLAARVSGATLCTQEIVNGIHAFTNQHETQVLIVEGAGGLAVPLNETEDMAKLCQLLQAQLVIVTRAGLGTLNHTALTLNYAQACGLNTSLVINGCHENPDEVEIDNIATIRKMSKNNRVTCIPYFKDLGMDFPEISFVLDDKN